MGDGNGISSWLVGLSNIYVMIEPDEETNSFHDGDFDGQEVVVLSVQDLSASESGLASTANCRFTEEGINRVIPISFLVQVVPAHGDEAVVVSVPPGGQLGRGQVVKVVSVQKEVMHVVDEGGASGVATDYFIEKERLCKYKRWS